MTKEDILKKMYEDKYINNGHDNGVLVAPQTSGSEILRILDFKKEGGLYTEFKNKNVTDI
jgi:hypothetical protein